MKKTFVRPIALACLLLGATAAQAQSRQLLLVASENKVELRDGAVAVRQTDTQDSLSVFDISASPARLLGRVDLPASVVGPPQSVALTPDLSLAIVTGATQLNPADKTKVIDGNQISVVDLNARPMAVVQSLTVGPMPAGVAISPDGRMVPVGSAQIGKWS